MVSTRCTPCVLVSMRERENAVSLSYSHTHLSLRPQACAFVWSELEEGTAATWGPGGATRVWLHHALESLDAELRSKHGSGIVFAAGDRASTVLDLSRKLVSCDRAPSTRGAISSLSGSSHTIAT